MADKKYTGSSVLTTLLLKFKDFLQNKYVAKELKTGSTTVYKTLTDNNLTDDLLTKINQAGASSFSGDYNDLSNKPDLSSLHTHDNKTILDEITSEKVAKWDNAQTSMDVQDAITVATNGLASEVYVDTKVADLINGAPESLDTLKELADAFATADTELDGMLTMLGEKQNAAEVVELTTTEVDDIWNSVFGV